MKVAVLTGSVSRLAGGTFSSIRRLRQEMLTAFSLGMRVFGLEDSFTYEDLPAWNPLVPQIFRAIGPKVLGYAPGYFTAVERFQRELWQFTVSGCIIRASA